MSINGQQIFKNFQAIITNQPSEVLMAKYGTTDLDEIFKRGKKGNFTNPTLRDEWKLTTNSIFGAYAADWREEGKEDPHGDYYERSTRGDLALGTLSDDQLANLAYMESDTVFRTRPNPVSSYPLMPIAIATAVKERLRWLSRRTVALEDQLIAAGIKPVVTVKD